MYMYFLDDEKMEISDQQKEILERMHNRTDYIVEKYEEYLNALSEFDKTGILKIHGKILYVRKYNNQENEDK